MRKKKKKPSARVTHVSVSRLYNTGAYTNVKYEIGAEVPRGASAAETLRQLTRTIQLLKPIAIPYEVGQLAEAEAKPEKDRSEYQKEHMEEWRDKVNAYNSRKLLRDAAVNLLDDLGGVSERRDAKQNWSVDDDTPF